MSEFCSECGQLRGVDSYDEELWDIYYRIDDGRSHREALVFTSDYLAENIIDDDDVEILNLTMERDMHSRGLCTECGRPDLRGINKDDILSKEDAQELAEMYAEQAAERRMGC